jgi:hypothetical protein
VVIHGVSPLSISPVILLPGRKNFFSCRSNGLAPLFHLEPTFSAFSFLLQQSQEQSQQKQVASSLLQRYMEPEYERQTRLRSPKRKAIKTVTLGHLQVSVNVKCVFNLMLNMLTREERKLDHKSMVQPSPETGFQYGTIAECLT